MNVAAKHIQNDFALYLDGVNVSFDGFKALNNLNLYVNDGELRCLIGANAGLGIPLGDRCTIEAGLYVTGGSKVVVLDDKNQDVEVVKAGELAGKTDLLFSRNSQNGRIEVKTNKSAIQLNEELHANN